LEIYNLLSQDSLARFKKSTEFQAYLAYVGGTTKGEKNTLVSSPSMSGSFSLPMATPPPPPPSTLNANARMYFTPAM